MTGRFALSPHALREAIRDYEEKHGLIEEREPTDEQIEKI